MLRCFRLCLPVLIIAYGTSAALAQTFSSSSVDTPPSLLGSDGNLYGIAGGSMFSFSQAGVYTTLNSSLNGGQLCMELSNGTFLGVLGDSVITLTMQGKMTTLATLPSGTVCPVLAANGNYYGGNSTGGAYSKGYLYQLTPAGVVDVLYSFTGGSDEYGPMYPLVQASDGNLYGTGGTGTFFRFSAADGLIVLSSGLYSAQIYEQANGDFTTVINNVFYTITPQGAVTTVTLNFAPDGYGNLPAQGNVFFGGTGDLYVEENYPYIVTNGGVGCAGNYLQVAQLSPAGEFITTVGGLGNDESDDLYSDLYTYGEFLGGSGYLYGGASDESSDLIYNSMAGQYVCTYQATYYFIYSESVGNPSVNLGLSQNRILPGKSTTIAWDVNNAFSDTLKLCYGYLGAGAGMKISTSGSQAVTFSTAGTYTPAIVCGGTEAATAQVVVGGTKVQLSSSAASVTEGQSVTLTGTVENPGTPAPTGTVQFLYGSTVLGSGKVGTNAAATFTASTTGVPAGSYAVTAKYSGDGNYSAATSAPVTITVTP